MKTRIIHTKFWQDDYIGGLTIAQKLFFNYLLTNPHAGLCEMYELSDRLIVFETGISSKEIEIAKKKFEKDGRFVFYQGWVKVLNYEKYKPYFGEKNEVARQKECALVPKKILDYFNKLTDTLSIEYRSHIDTTSNQQSVISNKQLVYSLESGENLSLKKYSKIGDLTQKDFQEISEQYRVPMDFVMSKFEDLENWHLMRPAKNHYANYRRALIDWIKRDARKIVQEERRLNGQNRREVILK